MLIKKRWFNSLKASLLVAFSATALALGAVVVTANFHDSVAVSADGSPDMNIRVSPSHDRLASSLPDNVFYVTDFYASQFSGFAGPMQGFGRLLVVDYIDGDSEDYWKGANWQQYQVNGALTDFSFLANCGSWVYLSMYDLDGVSNKVFTVNGVSVGYQGYWYFHNNSPKPNLFGASFGGYANSYIEYGVQSPNSFSVVNRMVFPWQDLNQGNSRPSYYVDDYDPLTDSYSIDGIDYFMSGYANYFWVGMSLDPIDGTYEAGYSAGYADGYRLGKDDGLTVGYNDGYTDGRASISNGGATMNTIFGAVIGVPFSVLNGLSAFTVWDTAIVSILLTLCMVSIAIWVIKKVFL